jgi:hypothetical protein
LVDFEKTMTLTHSGLEAADEVKSNDNIVLIYCVWAGSVAEKRLGQYRLFTPNSWYPYMRKDSDAM